MSAEVEVTIDTEVGEVKKTRLSLDAVTRLAREAYVLGLLSDSPHAPTILREDSENHSFTTEYVRGQSFAEVFSLDEDWNAQAKDWSEAVPFLAQYIAAEQDLLNRGFMYRDLSPGHLIFTGDHAVLVDHEETLPNDRVKVKRWYLDSNRGTWATMAPEEFRGLGTLTEKTATYRSAVMAHVALGGGLPFPHMILSWRKRHAPHVARTLPRAPRRVFRDALDVHPERRHASPADFLDALTAAYEDTL